MKLLRYHGKKILIGSVIYFLIFMACATTAVLVVRHQNLSQRRAAAASEDINWRAQALHESEVDVKKRQ